MGVEAAARQQLRVRALLGDAAFMQVLQLLWIPYAAADVGALTGGWISSGLVRRGVPLVTARTTCMLLFTLLLPFSLLGYLAPAGAPLITPRTTATAKGRHTRTASRRVTSVAAGWNPTLSRPMYPPRSFSKGNRRATAPFTRNAGVSVPA